MARVKEETWPLNSGDSVAIPPANRHNGVASRWCDIWEYQVPSGQAHILKASHSFSIYLSDGSVVGDGTCRVRIAIKDQSKQDEKIIYGPVLFTVCKEFSDKSKIAKLGLPADLTIEERFYIVIQANDDGTIQESSSYFSLETIRVRSTV